jgi:RNA polymerase sigma-70 factor (ECF subfamily)
MKSRPPRNAPRQPDFEELYQRYSREVWALVYARRLNGDLALDIVQETFLRLWKQWQAGEAIDNPRAWLVRVARNLAEDHAKSAFQRNGTQTPSTMNGLPGLEVAPLEHLVREETLAQVRQVLAEMPEADRQILTLKYALGYDGRQIADVLAINPTAVHMRLSRARQRMAERLVDRGVKQLP